MKRILLGILFACFGLSIFAQDVNSFGISAKISKPCIDNMEGSVNGGVGIRYNITGLCYTGVQIEYTQIQGRVEGAKMDMDFVSIPMEIGCRIVENKYGFGIAPFAGIGINIATSGELEVMMRKKSMDIGGKTGVDLRFGINLIVGDCIEIGARYHIPVNSRQEDFFGKDAYFSVSLGAGIHEIF